jgi:dTDP-4-amino-4,6-dideoxygalactose transaminase
VLKGYNYRMEGMQGAVLRVKLPRIEAWTEARREKAAHYDALLAGTSLRIARPVPYGRHVYHCYVVRTPHRDALLSALHARDIQAGIHYPVPVHLQEGYADLGYGVGNFPHAEAAAGEVLSLPLYPEMTYSQVEEVAAAVREELARIEAGV